MAFRKTVASDPSVYFEFLDRYITGSNAVFLAVLSGLMEMGVVERGGQYYYLRLSKLSEYGINYSAIRGADFAAALRRLASELLKMEVVKGALSRREQDT